MIKSTPRILALIVPGVFQFIVVATLTYLLRNEVPKGQDIMTIVLIIVAMASSIFFLQWDPFNGFLKTHLFAVVSGILPWVVTVLILTAIYGTGGYWWLGVISLAFMCIIAAIISFPVNLFVWWFLRQLDRMV